MGVQVQVYIGAYVEIKAKPMEVVDEERKCLEHGAMKSLYCPLCGRPTVVVSKKSASSHTLYTLLGDDYEDVLSEVYDAKKGLIIATGNHHHDKSHIYVDTYATTISEIKPEVPAELVSAFSEFYADVLRVLRERAESVEVKFGVITYWS